MFLLAILGCSEAPTASPPPSSPAEAAPAVQAPLPTSRKLYQVTWRTEPSPPPLSTLFEIEATVTDPSGAPITDATVRIDATMPQHGHGMATKPENDPGVCDATGACAHPDGRYRTRGMKFHMPGEWTLRFDVEGPKGTDHLEVPVRI